jgi:hypothetical protein
MIVTCEFYKAVMPAGIVLSETADRAFILVGRFSELCSKWRINYRKRD